MFDHRVVFEQLGGRRFMMMTGAKNFVYDNSKNTLAFKIGRNASKANYVKITLRGDDLYTMEFMRITSPRLNKKTWTYSEGKTTLIKKYDGLWCDQLQEMFTEVTGMATRMPNIVWG